jgi:hypothetical protein
MNKSQTVDPNDYPPGWNRERVAAVLRHDESMTAEEEAAEIEAAEEAGNWMLVPKELVREVEQLIQKHESRRAS